MYFDTNESRSHFEAKEKLFDLILSRRVRILDQHGKEYEIFKGKFDNEFLHIESFVMDYSSEALFSSLNPPCDKYMSGNNKSPHCSMKGYFGAFKELPCEKCVKRNYGKYMTGGNKFASYRADLAYGYEGKHKIWLEIENTSPCSKNKIDFCKNNDITLLEISSYDVNNFNKHVGDLIFNKLEEYEYKYSFYDELKKLPEYIEKIIKNNGFSYYTDVFGYFATKRIIKE